MLKNLFFTVVILLPLSQAYGALELRWLGVASFLIEDGESKIMFDPAWTRPGAFHWLGMASFKSDPELVDKVLAKIEVKKIDAVLVTHSHYDHIIDAPEVARKTSADFYVDKSFETIARAYSYLDLSLKPLEVNKPFQVGKFKITAYQRDHAPLMGSIDFVPGNVPKDFHFNFWDYKAGRTWIYLIEHPEGVILFHNTHAADQDLKTYRPDVTSADILIQGVTKSDATPLVNGYASTMKPKAFIANHFDNFLLAFDFEKTRYLPTINLNDIESEMKKAYPQMMFVVPELWKKMRWEARTLTVPAKYAN